MQASSLPWIMTKASTNPRSRSLAKVNVLLHVDFHPKAASLSVAILSVYAFQYATTHKSKLCRLTLARAWWISQGLQGGKCCRNDSCPSPYMYTRTSRPTRSFQLDIRPQEELSWCWVGEGGGSSPLALRQYGTRADVTGRQVRHCETGMHKAFTAGVRISFPQMG